MSTNREILMKFITGQTEKARQDVSMQGYKDDSPYRNNPSNTIYGTPDGTSITMEEVSIPLVGRDEFGNTQKMFPGQKYEYPGSRVVETPMAKYGGLLNKTIKCSNCGWSWKAADGGNDVSTCHKCGNENTIMQLGGEPKSGEKDFENVKDWYNAYIQSPLYKQNLEKSGYKNPDELITQRQASVNRAKYELDENRLGSYYRNATNKIHNAPKKDAEIWYPSVLPNDAVLAHEFGHVVLDSSSSPFGSNTPNWNKYDYNQLTSRNKNPKISRGAHENYADQKAMQYEAAKLGIYKPGFEEFTKEHLDKLPVDIKDRALQNYSEEDLIWLMNNIAQNNNNKYELPIAQEGGEEEISDEELQKKIKEQHSQQIEYMNKLREEEKINDELKKKKQQEEYDLYRKENFNEKAIGERKKLFNQVINENENVSNLFHEQWMASPQYQKLLAESTKENNSFDLFNNIRNNNLQELKGKKINTSEDSFRPGVLAYFDPKTRSINYPFDSNELNLLKTFFNDEVRSNLAHEKSHFIDNLFADGQKRIRLNSQALRKEFKNREDDEVSAIPQKDVDLINQLKKLKTDDNKYNYDYYTEPTEVRARLNQIRENLHNRGNKEFLNRELNEEDLKALYDNIDMSDHQYLKELDDYFGKENTIQLLNSISQNNNSNNDQMVVAKNGGSWFGNADEMSVSNKYQNAGTVNPTNIPKKNINTKEAAQRVVQIAEDRIRNNNYVTDIPQNVRDASAREGKEPFTCIGGVCTVLKEAGVMDKVDWSNTHFSEHAKEYGFTANQGWGVKGIENLEPGDVLQHNNKSNNEGNYYPGHSQIYLGKDASGQLRFFDNFWKTEKTYSEYEIKDLLDRVRKKTEPSATIYKVNPYDDSNPYGLTPEEKKNYDDKQEFIKKESASKASYKWNISPTAKNYNNTTKRVMDKFIAFANDNDKINDLVKKTGKSKEEIHDSLLNVFGELGAENNWTTSKGKGLGSRMENVAESVLTAFGGGKRLSVGPGQIKFNSIPQDLREKFNIQSPNDLYDLDKVLPLMAAMDLKDKQVLENWGKNNTLSKKLFGFTNPVETEWIEGRGNVPVGGGFTAEDLPSVKNDDSQLNNGIGRYSPYLRNQYSSIASGNTWEGGNDWIPFNEGTLPNFTEGQFTKSGQDEMRVKYERDPGSYPFKVEQNWRNNLNRFIETNADGQVELNEVEIIKPKKNKRS